MELKFRSSSGDKNCCSCTKMSNKSNCVIARSRTLLVGSIIVLTTSLALSGCNSDPDGCGTEGDAPTYHPDTTVYRYPELLAVNYSGPLTPSGYPCNKDSSCKADDPTLQSSCQTIRGEDVCTDDPSITVQGFRCRGDGNYGGVCGLWRQSRWQALYESAFSAPRQAWCYTQDGEAGGWDFCTGTQSYKQWAPQKPCLPWEQLSNDTQAHSKLLHGKWMCPMQGMDCYQRSNSRRRGRYLNKEQCTVATLYAPGDEEWYNREIEAGVGCAIPAFAFFPAEEQVDVYALMTTHYGEHQRAMVDINNDEFLGPFCYTSTQEGPRPVQCLDVCGVKACSGHGVCTGNASSYAQRICLCHQGWQGKDCDEPVNRSITCAEVQAMGLDEEGEAVLYSLMVMPAFGMRYGIVNSFGNVIHGSAPFWVKAGLLLAQLSWVGFIVLCMISCCCVMPQYGVPGALYTVAAAFVFVFLTLSISWFCLIIILFCALFFLPLLAFLQYWNFERAILLCIGPVGVNALIFPLLGFLVMVGSCARGYCWKETMAAKDSIMKAKESMMKATRLDWVMEVSSLVMQWSALAVGTSARSSVQSTLVVGTISVGALQLFSGIVALILLVVKVAMAFYITTSASLPIYIVKEKRGDGGILFWAAVFVVLVQVWCVSIVQISIAMTSPFLMGDFVPDFTIYSGLFSLYSSIDTMRVAAKAITLKEEEAAE